MGLVRSAWGNTGLMSRILNRRNAVLGWFVWRRAKRTALKRARRQRHLLRVIGIASAVTLVISAVSLTGRYRGSSIGRCR